MNETLRVLIVEDSVEDLALLLHELKRSGHEPDYVHVGDAASMQAALDARAWDLVISDHSIPGFDSVAALRLVQASGLDIPFIIVSGTIGEELAVEAMKAGASDYVMKGKLARLGAVIGRELAEAGQRRARRAAEQALREREQQTILELNAAYTATLEGWARALDLRDHETKGHCQRVADLTVRLALMAGLSEADCVHVRRGALLHDIGKMGIPDHILLKPSALDPQEWEIMQRHPAYALDLLKPIDYLRPALDIPYCHHEKWDGTGYPRGLAGEQVPLAARLFAVADIWDALRSDRPYRAAWTAERAREHILSLVGSHLDPRAVATFMALLDESPHEPGTQLDRTRALPQTSVLVVDDVEPNLELLERWFRLEGYDVRTAVSGETALAAIADRHPDMLLIDVGIPRPDGFTVCRRLRQNPSTSHIPFIIMSGMPHSEHEKRARELGAAAYFTKPFDLHELKAQVDRVLQPRAGR
jgi:putative two-component system response regulator